MNILCIIPARLHSTRLEKKLLLPLGEKSVIQHVYDNCMKVSLFSDVIIATDSHDIALHCNDFGAKVIMTQCSHESGTDRIYEAYVKNGIDADLVVNVQADEPFLTSLHIQSIVNGHIESDYDVCTGISLITDESEYISPSVVKVVIDKYDCAMYFSRSPIPMYRDNNISKTNTIYKHIGIYSYKVNVLQFFTELPQSKYESIEKLEQLRLLEQGKKYLCIKLEYDGFGIDTYDDYQLALNRLIL